ncbi:MAG: hypothetical protein ACI9M6_000875 [Hydrogenophaga sp.]|jgi:hypothetical protein
MKKHTLPALAALAMATSLLVGCGGGGDDSVAAPEPSPPVAESVPAAIGSSVDALIAFAKGLVSDNTAEPLRLGTVQPATDDTAEPTGL